MPAAARHFASMGKIEVPYFNIRPNKDGTRRFLFQPKSTDRAAGWKAVRLHDAHHVPIADEIQAAEACRKCADIYKRWREGDRSVSAAWIDAWGLVREPPPAPASKKRKHQATHAVRYFAPGTLGAVIADYKAWKPAMRVIETEGNRRGKRRKAYGELEANTRRTYDACLDLLEAAWGDRPWRAISAHEARKWIMLLIDEAPYFGHYVMRVARLVLAMTRFIHPEDHPGHVPLGANPFRELAVPSPESEILPWPGSLIHPYVAFCDAAGKPGVGDYVLFNSWLGQRINDMIALPADRFSLTRPLWVGQHKTGADVVLPWSMVPELQARHAQAVERRAARAVRATTFFYDDRTGRPWAPDELSRAHADLRSGFGFLLMAGRLDRTTRWPADFLAKHFEDDPFAVDFSRLELRTLRATAVTLLADKDVSLRGIAAVTGHSRNTIEQILSRHYRKRTARQAGAAFAKRLASEGGQS